MSSAAQQLSEWIEQTHPGLYDQLYGVAQQRTGAAILRRARLKGFGDDGDFTLDTGLIDQGLTDVLSQTAVQPLDLSTDFANALVDTGSIASQYTPPVAGAIQPLTIAPPSNVNTSFAPPPSSSGGGTLDAQTDSSGGFLQSIGSGIANAASSVGHFLTSAQGLTALTTLGTAYFKLQQNNVNAQLQQQVLQAQIARAQSGQSPAPISYVQGPGGSLIPVFNTSTGHGIPPGLVAAINSGQSTPITLPDGSMGYTIPNNLVGSLGGSLSLTQMLPWIALIGGVLFLLANRNPS
jgi:hypothetical protein